MKVLVTGGCGFLGTNLTHHLLEQGDHVLAFDNLSRFGSENNLAYLRTTKFSDRLNFVKGDIRTQTITEIIATYKPDAVFHLSGQVAMTTSLENPRLDFETNVLGGFNLLEAVRLHAPSAPVFYSSTNKVYGDMEHITYSETDLRYKSPDFPEGFDESLPLDFRSPYGCSKGAIDQYFLDYARMYDLKTVVFRHSSIFGSRQFSTFDQGWVGWFVRQALETKKKPNSTVFTISGNGKQVRDILFTTDLITCYMTALAKIDRVAGHAFNIGGGMANSLSLLELFQFLEKELHIQLRYECGPPRASDQKIFVAHTQKADQLMGWKPTMTAHEGLRQMIHWVASSYE